MKQLLFSLSVLLIAVACMKAQKQKDLDEEQVLTSTPSVEEIKVKDPECKTEECLKLIKEE